MDVPSRDVADLRRPGAEKLFHQITGQLAVLRGKVSCPSEGCEDTAL
jgi:hypothetical protein